MKRGLRKNEQLPRGTDCPEKGNKSPGTLGDYWSPEDLQALEDRFWNGDSLSEIALEMGRSEAATNQQVIKMGLMAGQCKPRNRSKTKQTAECLCFVCGVANCQNCGRGCTDAGGVR